jgi:uncharacterized protein
MAGKRMEQVDWGADRTDDSSRGYDFADPQTALDESAESTLIRALAKTKAFRRLTDVRFLGALDYCFFDHPNGSKHYSRYTRTQHSIGVAALARAYLKLRPHSSKDRLLCVAAAMLHDVGHPPFSHTVEKLFVDKFGFDHHDASVRIILGQVPIGKEIFAILRDFGINPTEVVDVLSGNDEKFDGFFSGPINFDTIEGILRTRNYQKSQNLGITPLRVLIASAERHLEWSEKTVDAFWNAKDEAYGVMIRSPAGVLCDLIFCEIVKMSIHLLDESDFYSDETNMFKKIPRLREILDKTTSVGYLKEILPSSVKFQKRSFYIDKSVSFRCMNDRRRYLQSKSCETLTLKEMLPS